MLHRLLGLLQYAPNEPLLFNTGLFLFVFLAFIAGYTLLERRTWLRMAYVVAFSSYFYYKNAGACLRVLWVIAAFDYILALVMDVTSWKWLRKLEITFGIVVEVGILTFFKYAGFLAGILGAAVSGDLLLPVGISFFIFQSLGYLIDVYRRNVRAERNPLALAFFVTFFPTLLSGPILRAKQFLPQLRKPLAVTSEMVTSGAFLIAMGLVKKAVISDYISANFVERIFANPTLYTGVENLLGLYGYALQLYCDFSGYSDMAIGLALWMGFQVPANFRAPYKSVSITDFWRRWHISLSSWLRDYLYIPLGGNRKGRGRMYLNLFFTMLIGGLWHGASWNFLIWGAVHGAALGLHKWFRSCLGREKHYESRGWRRAGAILLTFHLVCFCWLFFRGESFADSWAMLTQIFTQFHAPVFLQFVEGYPAVFSLLVAGYLLHFLPESLTETTRKAFCRLPWWGVAVGMTVVILIVMQVKSSDVQPFLYFHF